jgi:hypothetical protein
VRTFIERHARIGIITNQTDGFDPSRPHAATNVCGRDDCQRRAREWVAATTNETAVFVASADLTARAGIR